MMKVYNLRNLIDNVKAEEMGSWDVEVLVAEKDSPPCGGPLNTIEWDEEHKILILSHEEKKDEIKTTGK